MSSAPKNQTFSVFRLNIFVLLLFYFIFSTFIFSNVENKPAELQSFYSIEANDINGQTSIRSNKSN